MAAELKSLTGTSSSTTVPIITVTSGLGLAISSIKIAADSGTYSVLVESDGNKVYLIKSAPASSAGISEVLSGTLNLSVGDKLYVDGGLVYHISYLDYFQ